MERSRTAPEARTALGRDAEERAAAFLVAKHYRIIVRNYRWKRGEADIIARAPDGAVVLVEVRSARKASTWLKQSVNAAKMYHLRQTLDVFIARYPSLSAHARRIEIVWVVADVLEHWPHPL